MGREREGEDFDERFSKGKESIYIIVEEMPESCLKCVFYTKNVHQENVTGWYSEEDAGKYNYCFLRARLVNAQYGGVDISKNKQYLCPLLTVKETDEYIEMMETLEDHEERISELEETVAELKACCDEMHGNS